MTVKRIVTNVETSHPERARAFYGDILGLRVVMDQGWIMTFAAGELAAPQISFASGEGNETPVPAISIKVDDLDDVYGRMIAGGYRVEYGPAAEPWGVRRFFVRYPFGRLVNIMMHGEH